MTRPVQLIYTPTVIPIAEMQLIPEGLEALVEWLEEARPECDVKTVSDLSPDTDERLTGNERLVEIAGRKCYDSFGAKAGRRTNAGYVANLFGAPGKIPHASVLYHAKMSFFVAGVSRRVSHELIRNYVGADRSQEGCPSQESTRYTEHAGFFTVHPRVAISPERLTDFREAMQRAYDIYLDALQRDVDDFAEPPRGMARKRIYEAAAQLLPGAAATSFVWTTNPQALQKLFTERGDKATDLEFQRLIQVWRSAALKRWPNLFRETNPEYENER